MNKLINLCLCFAASTFATLDLYDTNGNITNPLDWCDKSDPVKAEQFTKAMNEKYNEMLENPSVYTCSNNSVNFINLYNAYKTYKKHKAYKAYEKSAMSRSIACANKHILLFLIDKDLLGRLMLHDDINLIISSGHSKLCNITDTVRDNKMLKTTHNKLFYDRAKMIEYYDIDAAVQYNDTSPNSKNIEEVENLQFENAIKVVIKFERLQNVKIMITKRHLNNKAVDNAFNNAQIEFDRKYGNVFNSIECEENFQEAQKIVLLNAFTELACIHGYDPQRQNPLALEIVKLQKIETDKYQHSHEIMHFMSFAHKTNQEIELSIKCDLSTHPALYCASKKILIKNESQYPAAININASHDVRRCILDGKFHFIYTHGCFSKVSLNANSTCKTLLINEIHNSHIKGKANISNIINYDDETLATYIATKYCNDMHENYKQSNEMPDFKDWIKSCDSSSSMILENGYLKLNLNLFTSANMIKLQSTMNKIDLINAVNLSIRIIHKIKEECNKIQRGLDIIEAEINRLNCNKGKLIDELQSIQSSSLNLRITEINNKLYNINAALEVKQFILKVGKYRNPFYTEDFMIHHEEILINWHHAKLYEIYTNETIRMHILKYMINAYSFISGNSFYTYNTIN